MNGIGPWCNFSSIQACIYLCKGSSKVNDHTGIINPKKKNNQASCRPIGGSHLEMTKKITYGCFAKHKEDRSKYGSLYCILPFHFSVGQILEHECKQHGNNSNYNNPVNCKYYINAGAPKECNQIVAKNIYQHGYY